MALYNITRSDITMENIRRGFFSCEGRLNRRRYIERFLAVSVICLILALFVYSIVFYATGDKTAAAGITSSVSVLETVAVYTLVVRRLHDLGYGKTIGVVYLVYGLGQSVAGRFLEGLEPDSAPVVAYELVCLAAMVFQICLMALRGVQGDNQYGKDPLPRRAA